MTISAAITAYWDAAAPRFDDEPDHGLRDAATRSAWDRLLGRLVPATGGDVVDLGCGTGTLAELLASRGHRLTGVDLAPRMVERARAKLAAAGLTGTFLVGDAAAPPVAAGAYDVVVARHLLWTLPDPHAALRRWVTLLRPGGTLVLVEGRWRESGSGAPYVPGAQSLPWSGGVGAADLVAAVRPLVGEVRTKDLSGEAALWGRPVDDERYALVAHV
ncbi:class I SAM-dependent methyltransferase [Streptomyces sp. NPDC047315]|uniref:class I SAM-dependent methyltransferase n=1 Tax=Streptomyces sp. NPDC047315 TaxID=3155142 RepID=UPI003409C006